MRFDPPSIRLSVDIVRKHFGAETSIWLFGSRTDNAQKGGDVDLLAETNITNVALPLARARGELADKLGRHVDLIVDNHVRNNPIFEIARTQGIRLA